MSSEDLLTYMGGTATGQTLTTAAYSLTMLVSLWREIFGLQLTCHERVG